MRSHVWRAVILGAVLGGLFGCGPDAGTRNATALSAPDPVPSDQALFTKGGGCFPPAITASGLELLTLVNPEWAPVVNGSSPFSRPVLLHGTAVESHVSKEDFPAAHVHFDQNTELLLDPADSGFLATGNLFPPNLAFGQPVLELEWETGSYPAWAWPGVGDRVVALGRWIFDCGHPDPIPGRCNGTSQLCLLDSDCAKGVSCDGTVFNYRSEMHPPQATAVIRSGRGAILEEEDDEEAVPVTRADVFVSPDGGGAGDACVVTHKGSQEAILGAPCFPLRAPLALLPPTAPPLNAQDFTFDLPRSRFVHVRVTLEGVLIRNPLKPVLPGVPTPPGWRLQANVNGEWQEIEGLEQVAPGSQGRFFPVSAAFDQFLPRDGALLLHAEATSAGCLDTLFGHSILEDLIRFGFDPSSPASLQAALQLGEICRNDNKGRDPGEVNATFAGPRFGARAAPYELASEGGDAGDGAFTLRFRIERVKEKEREKETHRLLRAGWLRAPPLSLGRQRAPKAATSFSSAARPP